MSIHADPTIEGTIESPLNRSPARRSLATGLVVAIVAVAAFTAGTMYSRHPPAAAASGRRILYYHDPMHPAYRSDKPGIAPDCGMDLEPVYSDGGPAIDSSAGTGIRADVTQSMGIVSEPAARTSFSH